MRTTFLQFCPPTIGEEEIQEVVDTLRSGWITTGPKTRRFEEEFRRFVCAPAALGLSSCTAALHIALRTLEIGPGDEVITTTFTFAATVNVIEHVGARPVLVDVEPDTLNIDPVKVEQAVGPKTRAIIPVHYAGHPAEMDAIRSIAETHGLVVIEDAAHAVAAKYKEQRIGSGKNPAAFSFYATKNLTTGEGGMLTGEPGFIDRARVLSLHGMTRDAWQRYDAAGHWYYEVVAAGFKYNMTDIQASLGLWQLRKLPHFQQRRKQIAAAYNAAFAQEEALETPVERGQVEHAWHLYVLRIRPGALKIDRDRFIDELKRRNIGASVHFIPIHMHPYYKNRYGLRPGDFPVAMEQYQRVISLPMHPGLTDQDVADVIDAVLDIVKKFKR